MGIALSVALVAGIAPATAIAAETGSPTGAVALQAEDAATAKEKAYAAMQEALKNLKAAEDAASPEKIAEIDDDIDAFQELYEKMLADTANYRKPLPDMQANVDVAQAKYNEASNRVSELQAELDKALDNGASNETIKQLQQAIIATKAQEDSCKLALDRYRSRLESQEGHITHSESEAGKAKANIDERTAERDALLDNLKRAQTAYYDACKAYGEAKAAADKATSPEVTQPNETTPPSGSTQPAETTPPASSPATGKDTTPSSTKQANTDGKQASTDGGKLANTGDTAPSAIALAGIAAMGLGITAAATHRIKYSK